LQSNVFEPFKIDTQGRLLPSLFHFIPERYAGSVIGMKENILFKKSGNPK